MPPQLINLYYFGLNEEKRIEAVRHIFTAFEQDTLVNEAVLNILSYFQWCRNCRNQILHSELYPAGLAGREGTLYLSKRISKQSPQFGYMKFKLRRLRYIADRIRKGVVQSAELHIYLRFRGRSLTDVPHELQVYVKALPKKLRIPQHLKLDPHP